MATYVKSCTLSKAVRFTVQVREGFSLDHCQKKNSGGGSHGFWRSEINGTNFNSRPAPGKYWAEVCCLNLPPDTFMSASVLIDMIDAYGGIGPGAYGGALVLQKYREKLPSGYILCPDKKKNLWKDERGFVRVPRIYPDSSGWDYNLDYEHRNDLSGQLVLIFYPSARFQLS